MKLTSMLAPYLPILTWGRTYNRGSLTNDLTAAVIVTIMLIPQSLAYAMLAGLPPQMGLYASILPITLYAIFGTSRSLAVGPVAVVSLLMETVGYMARKSSWLNMSRMYSELLFARSGELVRCMNRARLFRAR